VMLSQRNLSANVGSILNYLELTASDRGMTLLPFYYSYGNSVLLTHLSVGACLVLESNFVYPHRVVELMAREGVTGLPAVASMFLLLLNRVRLDQYDLSRLRYLTQAGGPMSADTARRLQEALPQAKLFVMYGQTEATARICYLPPNRLSEKAGSVGIAIQDVTIDVRDEKFATVGIDQVGEVCVRGPNVMLGYWNDPAATNRSIVDGWLKTGDLGRRDADGYLYLLGRRDDVLKIGGHRVNPAEIEEVVAQLAQVEDVAAVGCDDSIMGQVIKVLIVLKSGENLDEMGIKAHCRDNLAAYKVPKYVEAVRHVPKTASGKIKRFLLKNPAET
jgi:long-chain acyl-CoA synthetase